MIRPWVLPLGLLVLPFLAARADGRRAELERGKSLYRKLEFEQCLAALKRAQRTVTEGRDLVELELYLGLCEAGVNHTREVTAHFQTALELDSTVQLPPKSSPKVVTLFRLLKERAAARLVRPPAPEGPGLTPPLTLEPALPTEDKAQPAWAPEVQHERARRPVPSWVGLALGATTLAGAAGFTFFGLQATAQANQANAPTTYGDDAARLGRSAQQQARLANVSLALGGAALSGLAVVLVMNLSQGKHSP